MPEATDTAAGNATPSSTTPIPGISNTTPNRLAEERPDNTTEVPDLSKTSPNPLSDATRDVTNRTSAMPNMPGSVKATSTATTTTTTPAATIETAATAVLDKAPAVVKDSTSWSIGKMQLSGGNFDSGELLTAERALEAAQDAVDASQRDTVRVALRPTETTALRFNLGRKTGIKSASDLGSTSTTGWRIKVPLVAEVTLGRLTVSYGQEPPEEYDYISRITLSKGSWMNTYTYALRSGVMNARLVPLYQAGKVGYRLVVSLTDLVGFLSTDPDDSEDWVNIAADGTMTLEGKHVDYAG